MNGKKMTGHDHEGCRHAADAVALALGNACPESLQTAAHMATCAECRQLAAAAARLAALAREQPLAEPSPQLTQRIMAALPPPARHTRRRLWRRAVAAAAALTLVLGGSIWLKLHFAGNTDSASNWLAHTQLADGSWAPEGAAGATATYAPALTAMAALALERRSPGNRQAVDRAIAALLAAQNADGSLAAAGSARAYNHSMATAALLAIRQLRPAAVADTPLQRAVAYIQNTQCPAGAWGYGSDEAPNTALTVWHTEALQRAAALGWGDAQGHLRRAVRWLRAQQTSSGRFAYDATPGSATATLDAMGYTILLEAPLSGAERAQLVRRARATLGRQPDNAPSDYYRDFFTARALDAIGDTVNAAALRDRIAAQQRKDGAWRANDRWSMLGGDLYATAMAMLTLR